MRAAAVIVVGALAVACGGESAVGGEPSPATGGATSAPVQSSGSGGYEAPATGGTTSGAGGLETAGGASGADTGGTPQGGGEAGEAGRFLVGCQAGRSGSYGDSGSAGEDPAGAAGVVEAGGDGGATGGTQSTITGGQSGSEDCECLHGSCCDGCHFKDWRQPCLLRPIDNNPDGVRVHSFQEWCSGPESVSCRGYATQISVEYRIQYCTGLSPICDGRVVTTYNPIIETETCSGDSGEVFVCVGDDAPDMSFVASVPDGYQTLANPSSARCEPCPF